MIVLKKKQYKFKKNKKGVAKPLFLMYTTNCCDMIAMKREVAAFIAGVPWSECQVRKLTTSHCTNITSTRMSRNNVCNGLGHTRESVQSPLVVLKK